MRHRTAVLLVVGIGVMWGLNWPAVRIALGQLDPWTLRLVGFGGGAALLLGWALAARQSLRVPRRERGPLLLAALFNVAGFNLLTAFGQLAMSTSGAAIVAYTMPVWTTLLAIPLLGERPGARLLLGLACGMAGVAVLAGPALVETGRLPPGVLLMLGAALCWAAGTIVVKKTRWTIPTATLAGWQFAVSFPPIAVAFALLGQPPALAELRPEVVGALAYHLVFSIACAHIAWFTVVQRLDASEAAISTLMVPVVGVFSAILLLGEPLEARTLLALALVLAALTLVLLRPKRRTGYASAPSRP